MARSTVACTRVCSATLPIWVANETERFSECKRHYSEHRKFKGTWNWNDTYPTKMESPVNRRFVHHAPISMLQNPDEVLAWCKRLIWLKKKFLTLPKIVVFGSGIHCSETNALRGAARRL